MPLTVTVEVEAAHARVVALIGAMPDAALNWQPGGDEWSPRQVIGHLAHANDFYVIILEQARAARFGTVRLHRDSAGWRRMLATDAAVAQCTTSSAVLDHFERGYQKALVHLKNISTEELDRPFAFYTWHPDAQLVNTTLRQRVIHEMANHLKEHQAQLADLLARWQRDKAGAVGVSLLIRTARPVERDAVASIHENSATVAYAHIFGPHQPFPREQTRQRWVGFAGQVIVAEMETLGIVGFVAFDATELHALYVLPGHWHQGIGHRLLEAAGDVTALWVLRDNAQARRFYESHGWRPTAAERRLGDVTEIRYGRDVTGAPNARNAG